MNQSFSRSSVSLVVVLSSVNRGCGAGPLAVRFPAILSLKKGPSRSRSLTSRIYHYRSFLHMTINTYLLKSSTSTTTRRKCQSLTVSDHHIIWAAAGPSMMLDRTVSIEFRVPSFSSTRGSSNYEDESMNEPGLRLPPRKCYVKICDDLRQR